METAANLASEPEQSTPAERKNVPRRLIVNKLNYINFQERSLLVNLKHRKYDNVTTLEATPLPCSGEILECLWKNPGELGHLLKTHDFHNILIPDDQKLYLITPRVLRLEESGLTLVLPEHGNEAFFRRIYRHPCFGISAQFIQNSIIFPGVLADFNPLSFRLSLQSTPELTFRWINPESPTTINLFSGKTILYSGECRIIRHGDGQRFRDYVLEPGNNSNRKRFIAKKYRSTRQELLPAPNIVFHHPFTGKVISLKVVDLSGTGFAVEEDPGNSVLLPGMIIPKVELNFADSFRIACKAQVVYRNPVTTDDDDPLVRCGIAILDMSADEHVRLLSLLQQAANSKSYIGASVDMDALWRFFFATGFIYPEKYAYFETNKEEIKRTYDRLYSQSPHIARHFIYQSRGMILGHMAMMRFYENSWLIHHHAASKEESMRAGVAVLNQIGRFINDSHNIHSIHMNYVFCYFRPNNKFPDRVFGGLARRLKAPKECSLDTFAYFHCHPADKLNEQLPDTWVIADADKDDLQELDSFYKHESGGLMLDALDLKPDMATQTTLVQEYAALGFRKERYLFALRKEGDLKALAMVNISDIGLNMSNLTNCPTVIVLDDDVTNDILSRFMSFIATKYDGNEIPVLLYPATHAMKCDIPSEKLYNLWVLNMQHTDHYFKYLEHLIKHIQH